MLAGQTLSPALAAVTVSSLDNNFDRGTQYTNAPFMAATGGTGSFSFALASGSAPLPLGLKLNANGTLSGYTCEPNGAYKDIVVSATSGSETGSFTLQMQINRAPPGGCSLTLNLSVGGAVTNGVENTPYSGGSVVASGGTGPYTYALLTGALPTGLTLNADGTITGTPAAGTAGTYTFSVQAFDATPTTPNSGSASFTIVITATAGGLAITTASLPNGSVGQAYAADVDAIGGTAPITYAFDGPLPAGLSNFTINSTTGAISGTPSAPGTYTVTVKATDAATPTPSVVTKSYTFTVSAGLVITTTSLATPTPKAAYSQTVQTAGGTNPITFAVVAGALPAGLVLDANTGVISGTTTKFGTYTFTVRATDANGATDTQDYRFDTRPDPSLDPNVKGILVAQARTSQRFARTQMDLVRNRLDQLHEEDTSGGCTEKDIRLGRDNCIRYRHGVGVSQFAAQRQDVADMQPWNADAGREYGKRPSADQMLRMPGTQTGRSLSDEVSAYAAATGSKGGSKAPSSPAAAAANPAVDSYGGRVWNVWTAGSIVYGRYDATGKVDDKFTTGGLALGVDTVIVPGLKGGVAVGYGADETTVNTDGTRNTGSNLNVTAYLSQKIWESVYLDGLVGYAKTSFDSRRWQGDVGTYFSGDRNGHVWFESAALTWEQRSGAFRFAPYVRLDLIQVGLNAYAETGGDMNMALNYAKSSVNSVDGVIGIRTRYDVETSWGTMGPVARLEYVHSFSGTFRQSMSYTIDPTTAYSIVDNGAANWTVNGSLGLMMNGNNGVSGGVELLGSTSGSAYSAYGARANIRVAF